MGTGHTAASRQAASAEKPFLIPSISTFSTWAISQDRAAEDQYLIVYRIPDITHRISSFVTFSLFPRANFFRPSVYHIIPANTTLAAIPAKVASRAPARVQRVFLIFTAIK